ncbi:MAG: hypothetical protein LBI99_07075 [Propionibacteriaceae bacterium]|jgi:hypothetical protein|nr:hypothetical protein [Propionibacteriaceae bacterium]
MEIEQQGFGKKPATSSGWWYWASPSVRATLKELSVAPDRLIDVKTKPEGVRDGD